MIKSQYTKQTIEGDAAVLISAAELDHGDDVFVGGGEASPSHVTLQILVAELAVTVPIHHPEHLLHHQRPLIIIVVVLSVVPGGNHALELLVLHEPVPVCVRHRHHRPDGVVSAAGSAADDGVEGAEVVAAYLAVAVGVENVECRSEIRRGIMSAEAPARRAHACGKWGRRDTIRRCVLVCLFVWLCNNVSVSPMRV